MQTISNPTHDEIKRAAKALKDGHLVAFPTETVYGLGADATNEKAVSRIYSVKGRPIDHPLIVHISSINQLDKWAIDIPEYAIKLAKEFWPGPMTLILKRSALAKDFITGGQDCVGLRVPSQPVAFELLYEFESMNGQGVAAPSANRFGAVSPTTAQAACEEIGKYLDSSDQVLDGGPSHVGIESTIIDCTKRKPTILRPGAVTKSMVEICFGQSIISSKQLDLPRVSGVFKSHYAPSARVLIDIIPIIGDGFIAYSEIDTPSGTFRLASPKNQKEYASCLYEAFREADRKRLQRIVVISPKGNGIETAIRDRLKKASGESNL